MYSKVIYDAPRRKSLFYDSKIGLGTESISFNLFFGSLFGCDMLLIGWLCIFLVVVLNKKKFIQKLFKCEYGSIQKVTCYGLLQECRYTQIVWQNFKEIIWMLFFVSYLLSDWFWWTLCIRMACYDIIVYFEWTVNLFSEL